MRKQYHFWPGQVGLDVWRVERLIRLSRTLPVKEVAVESIEEVDSAYWFETGSDPPTVRAILEQMRLVQQVDLSHPIILGSDGRVMDGMHLVVRALLDGRSTLRAVRFEVDPEPDFRNCRPEDLAY